MHSDDQGGPGGQLFAATVTRLLAGEVVCRVTCEALYEYLSQAENETRVAAYIRRIGFELCWTGDRAGGFLVYRTLDKEARTHVQHRYREAVTSLEPMVSWLHLAASASLSGEILQAGDVIRGSDLLKSIESAPALVEELKRLSRGGLFANQHTEPKKQLEVVFRRLQERGYLVPKGTTGSLFVATALWSRLRDLMEFVDANEKLDDESATPEQADLIR
jgi:hypothetical protein